MISPSSSTRNLQPGMRLMRNMRMYEMTKVLRAGKAVVRRDVHREQYRTAESHQIQTAQL